MNVFNHSHVDTQEFSFILNEDKLSYQKYKDSLSDVKSVKVTINFDGINPPKYSEVSLYSESIDNVIYMGQYEDSITINIPEDLFIKEEGVDCIEFAFYDAKSNDIYVLMQEKPYIFWRKGADVIVHFLNEREYYNEDFALFIGYTVTLTDTNK